jgi:hypothetical protein
VSADTPTNNPTNPAPAADTSQDQDPAELIPLSPEEELFVDYLFEENFNRTRAYARAYPNALPNSARASASRMLARVNIKAEVRRRLEEEAMSAEEAIARLARIARGSMLPFLKKGPDGFVYMNLNDPQAEEYMFLVKEMEAKRQRRILGSGEAAEEWEDEWVRVKLYSSYEANIDILKLHGKFTKRVDLTTGGQPLPAVDNEGFDRSMRTLADAITSMLERDDSHDKTPGS